jgi:nucleoside-triphosphatase THEP1
MTQTINTGWMKAAVIGSIWAAIEIIVGSFLHNLRIPFAGALLAVSSVFLLTAFMQHWKEPYIILRAGIICALMKSISPSAVIFGPMIGIFTEALIIELSRLIFGRNLFAYLLGGALAVLWTLFQKIFNWLILYGFDLVKVVESLYDFLVMKTGISAMHPWYLIGGIFAVYMLAGAVGAIGGYFSAKRLDNKTLSKERYSESDFKSGNFFAGAKEQSYSLWYLFLIIVWVVSVLFLLNKAYWVYAVPAGIIFPVFIMMRYKNSVRHLKKPAIWIQFAVITLLASFLWEWASGNGSFSLKGLRVGLEMNFRAVIVIFGFAGISSELRNPLLKSLLFNYGFSNLYQSLNVAFSALPAVTASLPRLRNLYKQRRYILKEIFVQADGLLDYFSQNMKARKQILILTGDLHAGKTTTAKRLIHNLRKKSYSVKGIISSGKFRGKQRSSFELEVIGLDEHLPLASDEKRVDWFRFRRYWFNPEAITQGNDIIQNACRTQPDVLLIDEIGPMELLDKGWSESLKTATACEHLMQIWVIRKTKLNEAMVKWQLCRDNILDISKLSLHDIEQRTEDKIWELRKA